MPLQLICGDELLVAGVAVEYFVHLPVFLQVQRGGAFPVAYGARELPACTPCVDVSFVLLQGVLALEPLAAALRLADEPGVSFAGFLVLLKAGL